jgi:hypothetical protein
MHGTGTTTHSPAVSPSILMYEPIVAHSFRYRCICILRARRFPGFIPRSHYTEPQQEVAFRWRGYQHPSCVSERSSVSGCSQLNDVSYRWVVGALDSAWRAVYEYLLASGQSTEKFFELWGKNVEWTTPSSQYADGKVDSEENTLLRVHMGYTHAAELSGEVRF